MSIFARKASGLFRNFVNNNANISSQVLCSIKGSSAWSSHAQIHGKSNKQPQGVNPKKGGDFYTPRMSSPLEELELELKEAKEDLRELEEATRRAEKDVQAKEEDLAAAKRSGNVALITAATDLAVAKQKDLTAARDLITASKKHLTAVTDLTTASKKDLTALREKESLLLKQKPISKPFSKANDVWIESVTGIHSWKHQKWVQRSEESPNGYVLDEAVKPSDGFKAMFELFAKVIHMENEGGRRVFLNLLLSDVVVKFDGVLRIFPEFQMAVESGGRRLTGRTDYAVGFGKGMSIFSNTPPQELHLVAVEARVSIGDADFRQCVAETAALYKSRVDAKKTTTAVWGILSNATTWQFIHIDDSGSLWRSKPFYIASNVFTCYEEAEILPVYRFIHYVVNRCFECCTSPEPPCKRPRPTNPPLPTLEL